MEEPNHLAASASSTPAKEDDDVMEVLVPAGSTGALTRERSPDPHKPSQRTIISRTPESIVGDDQSLERSQTARSITANDDEL